MAKFRLIWSHWHFRSIRPRASNFSERLLIFQLIIFLLEAKRGQLDQVMYLKFESSFDKRKATYEAIVINQKILELDSARIWW